MCVSCGDKSVGDLTDSTADNIDMRLEPQASGAASLVRGLGVSEIGYGRGHNVLRTLNRCISIMLCVPLHAFVVGVFLFRFFPANLHQFVLLYPAFQLYRFPFFPGPFLVSGDFLFAGAAVPPAATAASAAPVYLDTNSWKCD